MTDGSVLLSAHFDAIIIGTGQAGPALAARLVGAGINVAVVERHQFGGTCVNTGCTPTKTLIASARVAYVARRAASFGVDIGGAVSVDMVRVKARKDKVAGRSSSGVEAWMRGLETCTVYQGHATLEGSDKVRVGAECVSVDTGTTGIGIGIDCESGDRVAKRQPPSLGRGAYSQHR